MSERSTPSHVAASQTPFAGLTPDTLMQAAESLGLEPDGRRSPSTATRIASTDLGGSMPRRWW